MKKITAILLSIFVFVFFTSCGDNSQSEQTAENTNSMQMDAEEESMMDNSNQAICLWSEAGLREKPGRGKDNKYLTTITFGEVVMLTGESEEIDENGRTRNYLEMELTDGKKGWSYDYLFAVEGERAVALSDMDIFKRPDLTTITGNKIKRGKIFAYIPSDKEGWVEAYGKEKQVGGWTRLNEDAFTTDEMDIALAIKLDQVKGLKGKDAKVKELEKIGEMFSSSKLISMVDEALMQFNKVADLPNTQLMITASTLNVRSTPEKADNIAFQVSEGDVCNILERSNEMVQIDEMTDYWYKIEKNGQMGWVYGHFTSKAQ